MGQFESKDQMGKPTPNNKIDDGRRGSEKPSKSDPKASGFKPVTPGMAPSFRDRSSVNPMGAKKGNPSGFPGL